MAGGSNPSSNFLELARAPEVVCGEAPAGARFSFAHVRSESFKVDRRFVRDDTIIGDRFVNEHIPVGVAVSCQTPVRWARGYIDWALELSFMSRFSATTEEENVTPGQFITAVTGATNTIGVAQTYVPGQLIETDGFENDANNRLGVAQAGTAASQIVLDGAPMVDDPAPQQGARVQAVGFEGAAGDIQATATGLSSTATDFTTFPNLRLNVPCIIGAPDYRTEDGVDVDNSAHRFDGGVAYAVTPTRIEANLIEFDDLPAAWAADPGAGKNIRVFCADDLDTGNDVITDSFQKHFSRWATPTYYGFVGIAAETAQINFSANALVDMSVGLIGFTGGKIDTPYDAAPLSPILGQVMHSGSSVVRLSVDGESIPTSDAPQTLNFNINNNLTPIPSIGRDEAVGYNMGDCDVSATLGVNFASPVYYDRFLNTDRGRVNLLTARGNAAYGLQLNRFVFTDAEGGAPGRNQIVPLTLTAEAERNRDGATWRAFRFRRAR